MESNICTVPGQVKFFNKDPQELSKEDTVHQHLNTLQEWEDFYYTYSQWMGFSVRKEDVRREKADNPEWQRKWVCSKQGFRREKWKNLTNQKKTPRAITRTGCLAVLRVNLDRSDNTWVEKDFNPVHNHDLAAKTELHFLRSNRAIPECIGAQEAEEGETDVEGALGYLECLGLRDPDFYETHTIDKDFRLVDLFWADGNCRRDYNLFGEIMAFDTTYRKNAYNKPLLIFVGVNHHFRTIFFAVALLYDETEETYIWVLQEFLECMKNKALHVIVTDGDHAMANAIKVVMPQSVHRLCAWHLQANLTSNAPHPLFKAKFNELLYQYCTEEQFEDTWNNMVSEFHLQESRWAKTTYANRKSWAECFLRGNFFTGLTTTQRSESINSYLSHFLTSKLKLRDLVGQVDAAIQNIRHTEREDDFISNHTSPSIPTNVFHQYYQQVASILTRTMYEKVAKQISSALSYSVDSADVTVNSRSYYLTRFPKGLVRSQVNYDTDHGHINCTCMLFESDGIPCRHIFAVMKHLNIPCIPDFMFKASGGRMLRAWLN
ncbi:protein FAR1-RELATED SEQUENCE 5-like [Humulus lupulus]|uniref:protein FAR1-RELATED SEQUENCE 5-like n=1 Tax=Humulus lupulus TaxID=3486 RepID=UPI002B401E99|nr:protein FAR1-RELATED SEQUENCE 5-like [Humulus lupulus]